MYSNPYPGTAVYFTAIAGPDYWRILITRKMPMKNWLKYGGAVTILVTAFAACRDEAAQDACMQPPFPYNITVMPSDSCESTGTLRIGGPGAERFQYQVNEGPLLNDPLITNLLPGRYRLGIKVPDCIYTDTVTVPAASPGPYFTQARLFINQYCISCHNPANQQAGIDFTRGCTIVNLANRIMARAFFGNPSPMPPTGLETLGERNKISVWYGAGARFTD